MLIAEAVAERINNRPPRQWLTKAEAAEHLRCSTKQIDLYVRVGEIPWFTGRGGVRGRPLILSGFPGQVRTPNREGIVVYTEEAFDQLETKVQRLEEEFVTLAASSGDMPPRIVGTLQKDEQPTWRSLVCEGRAMSDEEPVFFPDPET